MLTQLAAILASLVLFGVGIFQFLLVLGKPLGHYAWGGAHKVLPKSLRVGSVISIVIYALCAIIILDRAEIISILDDSNVNKYGIWFLVGFFGLGILMNSISRSKPERLVMTPVVTALTLLSLIVALG